MQNIRSVLAAPLIARAELQGAIYVDTRLSARPFGEAELRLLQAMASQAAMAIRGARLYEDVRESNAPIARCAGRVAPDAGAIGAGRAPGRMWGDGRQRGPRAAQPLMVMRNAIYYMERLMGAGKLDSPDLFRRYLGKLDGEIVRQNKSSNDLLFFSRFRPRQLSVVDLNAILDEAMMRVAMPESVKSAQPGRGSGDAARRWRPITAGVHQLISNACSHARRGRAAGALMGRGRLCPG